MPEVRAAAASLLAAKARTSYPFSMQYSSAVVPVWTETVLPSRSALQVMSLSGVTTMAWEARK